MAAIADMIRERCPKCGRGKVFTRKGNPVLFQMPRMNTNCPVCGHRFEKEPGYFFGSMFVSYAVTVAEMIGFFLVAQFFIESYVAIVVLIAVLAILLSTFNFRISRMIWMYMLDGKDRQV